MISRLPAAFLAAALLVSVAGCADSPQQPSDVVDDRSTEQPDTTPDQSSDPAPATTSGTGTAPAPGSAIATQGEVSTITGNWATTAAECGRGTDVVVTTTQYSSVEGVCDINNAISGGSGGGVTLTLECSGPEGDFASELLTLTPVEGGAAMDVNVVGGETPQRLVRCP